MRGWPAGAEAPNTRGAARAPITVAHAAPPFARKERRLRGNTGNGTAASGLMRFHSFSCRNSGLAMVSCRVGLTVSCGNRYASSTIFNPKARPSSANGSLTSPYSVTRCQNPSG